MRAKALLPALLLLCVDQEASSRPRGAEGRAPSGPCAADFRDSDVVFLGDSISVMPYSEEIAKAISGGNPNSFVARYAVGGSAATHWVNGFKAGFFGHSNTVCESRRGLANKVVARSVPDFQQLKAAGKPAAVVIALGTNDLHNYCTSGGGGGGGIWMNGVKELSGSIPSGTKCVWILPLKYTSGKIASACAKVGGMERALQDLASNVGGGCKTVDSSACPMPPLDGEGIHPAGNKAAIDLGKCIGEQVKNALGGISASPPSEQPPPPEDRAPPPPEDRAPPPPGSPGGPPNNPLSTITGEPDGGSMPESDGDTQKISRPSAASRAGAIASKGSTTKARTKGAVGETNSRKFGGIGEVPGSGNRGDITGRGDSAEEKSWKGTSGAKGQKQSGETAELSSFSKKLGVKEHWDEKEKNPLNERLINLGDSPQAAGTAPGGKGSSAGSVGGAGAVGSSSFSSAINNEPLPPRAATPGEEAQNTSGDLNDALEADSLFLRVRRVLKERCRPETGCGAPNRKSAP